MRSYGLNELDLKIFDIVKNIKNGFFIEAGANDGVRQNNTLILEQYLGWSGLLVGPNKKLAEVCKWSRPKSIVENYCLVSNEVKESHVKGFFGSTEYAESLMAQVSDVDEIKDIHKDVAPVEVPCCTLNFLLKNHSIENIDLFVLDVEGYEKEVLNGFNIERYKPSVIVIEIFDNSKDKDYIFKYFETAGYNYGGLISHHDHLFKLK